MSGKLTFTEMFKILVDGLFIKSYPQTFRGCITVGSAADAHVRLDRGAPLSLEIRPLTGGSEGDFTVSEDDGLIPIAHTVNDDAHHDVGLVERPER